VTALKIAEAVMVSAYGKDVLSPYTFNIEYDNSRKAWIVIGSLPDGDVGGIPEIVIRRKNGKIIKLIIK
jgi:hypothetical protein